MFKTDLDAVFIQHIYDFLPAFAMADSECSVLFAENLQINRNVCTFASDRIDSFLDSICNIFVESAQIKNSVNSGVKCQCVYHILPLSVLHK